MNAKETLKEVIIEIITTNKLSQEKLAALIGVSQKTVSNWVSGEDMPKSSSILAIYELTGITPNELLGIDQIQSDAKYKIKQIKSTLPAESGAEPAAEPLPSQRQPTRPLAPAAGVLGEPIPTEPGKPQKYRIPYAARGEGNLYLEATEEEQRKLLESFRANEIKPEDNDL